MARKVKQVWKNCCNCEKLIDCNAGKERLLGKDSNSLAYKMVGCYNHEMKNRQLKLAI